jgi:hypothetical protein
MVSIVVFTASLFQCPAEFFFSNSPFRYVGINYLLHCQCDVVSNMFFFLQIPLWVSRCKLLFHSIPWITGNCKESQIVWTITSWKQREDAEVSAHIDATSRYSVNKRPFEMATKPVPLKPSLCRYCEALRSSCKRNSYGGRRI